MIYKISKKNLEIYGLISYINIISDSERASWKLQGIDKYPTPSIVLYRVSG